MRTMFLCTLIAAAVGAPCAAAAASPSTLTATGDFEGGSARIESIDQQRRVVHLTPMPHKGRGWECWWYVKVTGLTPGETITIDLGEGKGTWGMPDRAAWSDDNRTWRHTAPGRRVGKRIAYEQKVGAATAWFAWGPPFVPSDAAALVNRLAAASPYAEAFELCKTLEGRPVPALRVSQPGANDADRYGVWINARQHAWESGASWVCRGLADWLLSDDPRAVTLRKKAVVIIVPIMDIDSTAIGAGGKEQVPHDHNRDWSDNPHFPSVRAAMKRIKAMDAAGRFDLFIDLHNPGPGDRQPFYFISPPQLLDATARANLARFVDAGRAQITGPLKLSEQLRESGANYDRMWKSISKNWVVEHTRDHVVAVTLETSWNTPASTTEGYMTVGRQQGLAIEQYLRSPVRTTGKSAADR